MRLWMVTICLIFSTVSFARGRWIVSAGPSLGSIDTLAPFSQTKTLGFLISAVVPISYRTYVGIEGGYFNWSEQSSQQSTTFAANTSYSALPIMATLVLRSHYASEPFSFYLGFSFGASFNKTSASYTLSGASDAATIDNGPSLAGWVRLGADLRIFRALRIFVEDRAGKLDSHSINFPQAGVELWF